jgi:hypothetical protein
MLVHARRFKLPPLNVRTVAFAFCVGAGAGFCGFAGGCGAGLEGFTGAGVGAGVGVGFAMLSALVSTYPVQLP